MRQVDVDFDVAFLDVDVADFEFDAFPILAPQTFRILPAVLNS